MTEAEKKEMMNEFLNLGFVLCCVCVLGKAGIDAVGIGSKAFSTVSYLISAHSTEIGSFYHNSLMPFLQREIPSDGYQQLSQFLTLHHQQIALFALTTTGFLAAFAVGITVFVIDFLFGLPALIAIACSKDENPTPGVIMAALYALVFGWPVLLSICLLAYCIVHYFVFAKAKPAGDAVEAAAEAQN